MKYKIRFTLSHNNKFYEYDYSDNSLNVEEIKKAIDKLLNPETNLINTLFCIIIIPENDLNKIGLILTDSND